MPWGAVNWLPYGRKHFPKLTVPWPQQVEATVTRPACYAPDVHVQELEESVVEHAVDDRNQIVLRYGRPIVIGSYRFLYRICARNIGASRGQETNIVRVQWDECGDLDGRPVTRQELLDELRRKQNFAEIEYFNALKGVQ